MAEQRTHNPLVAGSSPAPRTINTVSFSKEFMMDENNIQIPDNVELPNPDNSIQSEDVAPIEVIDYG